MKSLTLVEIRNFLKYIPGIKVSNGKKKRNTFEFSVETFSTWSTKGIIITDDYYIAYIQEYLDIKGYNSICSICFNRLGNRKLIFENLPVF